MTTVHESGAQLIARLSSVQRPSLENLYPPITAYSHNHKKQTLFEITGESNVGKTVLLMELISKAILPTEFGGKSAQVLFLETDKTFQIQKFCTILEKHIREHKNDVENAINVTDIINESLKNIKFLKSYTADEFEISLQSLSSIFAENAKISFLAIDSINSFYWLHKKSANPNSTSMQPSSNVAVIRMDTYIRNLVTRIRKITDEYGIKFAFTKLSTKGKCFEIVDDYCKIELCEINNDEHIFEANVKWGHGNVDTKLYSIHSDGIKWIN